VAAAVIELDPLPDPVGSAAQNYRFLSVPANNYPAFSELRFFNIPFQGNAFRLNPHKLCRDFYPNFLRYQSPKKFLSGVVCSVRLNSCFSSGIYLFFWDSRHYL